MDKSTKKKSNKKNQTEEETKLASWTYEKFREAMLAKESYTDRWLQYLNAWDNSLYENTFAPSYKTNHVSNFVYSSIESMRPILFDSNPRFEAIPVTPESMEYSKDINTIIDWEWHRTNMQEILLANSIYTFALGTSIVMLPYTYDDENESDGNVTPIAVNPFNIYPDPLATCVEDCEYLIYANYIHVNKLKERYPEKADKLVGADIQYSELVNDRNENARVDNQVLVLEVWCRDYTTIDVEETDDDGNTVVNKKRKYPKGRVIISAPELNVILEDKENPYDSGRFPFFLFKDIDVPFQFWGEGEVKWLMSPQKQINDLYNQVIDNAKNTANAHWVIDRNAGIPEGQLTNRPGLVIRKVPGTDVHRESPPTIPMYVQQMIDTLKVDMEVISGVHDVTRGETPSGIQSAAAIQALQEAAQTRIRLKVTLHENALGVLGTEWINRIKQFWKFDRVIPRKVAETEVTPEASLNGVEMQTMFGEEPASYEMITVSQSKQLQYEYKVKIIGASTMQQSRASMLDQMIRLLQTPAEDGMPCVPREAVLDYIPDVNKKVVMQYFDKLKRERMAQQQQQMANNGMVEQLQMLGQQVQMLMQNVQSLQGRAESEDNQRMQEEIRFQGYQQGVAEANTMNKQISKAGKVPPELLEELALMNDDEFSKILQEYPELIDVITQE